MVKQFKDKEMKLPKAIFDFFREVRVELGKVVWPSRDQTIRLTLMVIIVTVIVGFFIGGIDYILAQLTKLIIK
jgi:preprotein translocase subunit SecE